MPSTTTTPHTLGDFDFALPPELIAQHPAAERSASRLLDGTGARARRPRVPRAARPARSGRPAGVQRHPRHQGAAARRQGQRRCGRRRWSSVCCRATRCWPTCAPASRPSRAACVRFVSGDGASSFEAEVLGRGGPDDSLFHLRFPGEPLALLRAPRPRAAAALHHACRQRRGRTPLPDRVREASRRSGRANRRAALRRRACWPRCASAASACASVTLHVGAGTFQPVRTENLAEHRMHSEWFEVARGDGRRGRSARVPRAGASSRWARPRCARWSRRRCPARCTAGSRDTDIFITPGFEFRVVDRLLTNFHLPKSTLMMLVSAFAGHAHVMALYRHAIARALPLLQLRRRHVARSRQHCKFVMLQAGTDGVARR